MMKKTEQIKKLEGLVSTLNKTIEELTKQPVSPEEAWHILDLLNITQIHQQFWRAKAYPDCWEEEAGLWTVFIDGRSVSVEPLRHHTEVVWKSLSPEEQEASIKDIARSILRLEDDPR